jgi:hypothetical protein
MKTEETQLGLQMSLNTQNQSLCRGTADKKDLQGEFLRIQETQVVRENWTQSLHNNVPDTKKDLHKQLNLRLQGTQVAI